jgi:hypothetical protein
LEGARHALDDQANPLRLNFFSTAMRILFEHMMESLAPSDAVRRCSWFKAERDNGLPTRWQRAVYAIQGGLDDDFVAKQLKVDIAPLRRQLLDAIDNLSTQVHAREDTIVRDTASQDAFAHKRLKPFEPF